VQIRHEPDNHRYIVEIDDQLRGEAVYGRRDGRVVFTHTEVDDSLEGQGVGSRLASFALDDVRTSGARVVPLCPFIAGYIERHDEYADLVDDEMLASLRDERA
jgi:uncharacterized protein